ncbi:MAG: site-specific integrase [Candidatus Bathyarchaeia archaeon]
MADTQGSVQNAYFAPSRLASPTQPPKCPNCGSARAWKDGLRKTESGSIQRWLCRECGFRFSSSSELKNKKGNQQTLKCRVCVADGEAKNLAEVESQLREGKWEATSETGELLDFLWWMKKQGYAESTILGRGRKLRRLLRLGADLYTPETVKEILARQKWSEGQKEVVVEAYDLFLKWKGQKWDRPIIRRVQRLPFIPLEREIDDLIAGSPKHVAAFLQLLKETGARAGEALNLRWEDIDFEKRTVTITPEKGSEPRIFRLSNKLVGMLNQIQNYGERVFGRYRDLDSITSTFARHRKRLAHNLSNPRILKISFHTFRHWKATMEYARTKDILYVMKVLGHKSLKNTLIYTQLTKFENEEEFVCKVAKEPTEIAKLVEEGFEYVCDQNELKFFRKRK